MRYQFLESAIGYEIPEKKTMDAIINAMRLGVEMDLGTYLIIYLASYIVMIISFS
jgi:hypothetical protein